LQVAQDKLEQHGQNEELENEIMSHGLSTIWKLGHMEIEKMVRDVCQVILKVPNKKLKKKRAAALKELGELYRREVKLAKKKGLDTNATPFDQIFTKGEDPEKNGDQEKEKGKEKETEPLSKEKAKTPSKQRS